MCTNFHGIIQDQTIESTLPTYTNSKKFQNEWQQACRDERQFFLTDIVIRRCPLLPRTLVRRESLSLMVYFMQSLTR